MWGGFRQRVSSGISKCELEWESEREFEKSLRLKDFVCDSVSFRGPRGRSYIWSRKKKWTKLLRIRVWVSPRQSWAACGNGISPEALIGIKNNCSHFNTCSGIAYQKKVWLIFPYGVWYLNSILLNVRSYIPSDNAGLTTYLKNNYYLDFTTLPSCLTQ